MSFQRESIFSIRRAITEDVEQLYELVQTEHWQTFTPSVLKELIESCPILVAEKENKIVGYVRYLTDEIVTLFICELLADKSERRKGVAKTLLSELHSRYPHIRIELISEADSFYKNNYFREIGIGFRKYKTD